jgi:hypothetical protein
MAFNNVEPYDEGTYLVRSLKEPSICHLVDMNENDGFGECSCKWHVCNVQPKLNKGIKPFKTCRHLKAVKGYRLKLQNHPDQFQ